MLDLNNDDIITNGNELFGPHTGSGFTELSVYHEDGNNWIDEKDLVYDQLSVWTTDQQANGSLRSLRDKKIGAIYLGNLTSEFDLKETNNNLMAKINKTGIFLMKDGIPGVIQQLDLVV